MTIQQLLIIIGLLTIAGCITLWLYGLYTEGDHTMSPKDLKFKDDAAMDSALDDIKKAEKKYDDWCERQIDAAKKRHQEENNNDII